MPDYKLYTDWTAWWPLVHPPEGCAAEAAYFCQLSHDIHPRQLPSCCARATPWRCCMSNIPLASLPRPIGCASWLRQAFNQRCTPYAAGSLSFWGMLAVDEDLL